MYSNDYLQERCVAEIDLDSIGSNYLSAKAKMGTGEVICVLKADAYGMGAKHVYSALHSLGARHFAVACASEALELYSLGLNSSFLVLGDVSDSEALELIPKKIELTCHSPESALLLLNCAKKLSLPVYAHIKLDTGLHRLGFEQSDYPSMLAFAKDPCVRLVGLYTHLAIRSPDSDAVQVQRYLYADNLLKQSGISGYIRHVCDSIGMVRYPAWHFDAARVGAWLYGVCPYRYEHPEEDMLAVRFFSRIASIHHVPAGECVGYDDKNPLTEDSLVATLPVGYADGYPRLNSKGYVLIDGKPANILGLVCMDQLMIDVTHIPSARVGSTVTLLGDSISIDTYAAFAGMNRNEALSRLSGRAKRVYLSGGNRLTD
ncbi:MAG: alanine racemase [Clostridiales bacterium]|nr:alanine racemase [Clostridiales bacterium]